VEGCVVLPLTASPSPVPLISRNDANQNTRWPSLPQPDERILAKSTPNRLGPPHNVHPSSNNQIRIIGSGITGAAIAYKLLESEPSVSIVILEARQACSGATGRNGGHCRAGRYFEFEKYVETFGKEDALRLEKLEEEIARNVAKLIKELNIQCDLRDVETLDVFTDPMQWEEAVDALKARKDVLEEKVETEVVTKHRECGVRRRPGGRF